MRAPRTIPVAALVVSAAMHGVARAPLAAPAGAAADPIHVYYDGGDCGTSHIELQVWDRKRGTWVAHPRHGRVRVPSCQLEDAGRLLNELRWRCAPPRPDVSPPWRGLDVFDADAMTRCAVGEIDDTHRTSISVTSPAEGAVLSGPERLVTLRGSVDVDGIAGSEYDVVLLIDRTTSEAALAAQVDAGRALARKLAPSLGSVRIAVLSYPHPEAAPGAVAGARRELGFSADFDAIELALANLPPRPLGVSHTPVPAALHAAVDLFARARPSARRVIVIGVDGARLDATAEPAPDDPLLRAAARADSRAVTVHWIALGGLAPDDPVLVRRALTKARGSFRRVPPHAYATRFFNEIPFPVAEAVWIAPGVARAPTVLGSLDAQGRFWAQVPVTGGRNKLVIRARTTGGAEVERVFAFVFDDSLLNEKILEAERERIRAAQRKRLEIKAAPDAEPEAEPESPQ